MVSYTLLRLLIETRLKYAYIAVTHFVLGMGIIPFVLSNLLKGIIMAAALNHNAPAARSFSRPAQDDSWKAQGFINISIARPDGTKAKLSAIPLKDSRVSERNLRAWLEENPEANCATLLKALVIDYRPADGEGGGFDFSTLSAVPAAK